MLSVSKKTGTYGDWNGALKILKGLQKRTEQNIMLATKRNAMMLRDKIKLTIRNQRSEWPELSEITIARKGSSKMLIDHADMLNSVTYSLVDNKSFFIGVPRSAENSDGDNIADIAKQHEFGAETDKISSLGTKFTVVIPQRAFVAPTLEENKLAIANNWIAAVDAALKGKRFSVSPNK